MQEPPRPGITSAVSLRHVTKKFRLEHEKYFTIRELFLSSLLFWKRKKSESLVALDDISFEVPQGQAVGIIGDNGSGKSTLLKLILGITPPTTGDIHTEGKISALLELGAGFHPDLTGRENIYLNGSVLGISKSLIEERMDEIIDFAELRQFIDTPIKHYSSGMYVRLGFSIAVHVDPDILLVDEVLAVGDASFQQKCLDKVRKFQKAGKTIIIVSHDLGMIEKVCDRAILLNHGHIEKDSDAKDTVRIYYDRIMKERMELAKKYDEVQVIPTTKIGYKMGTGEAKILQVRILDNRGNETYLFKSGDPVNIEILYEAEQEIHYPIFGLGWNPEGELYLNGSNTKLRGIDTSVINGKGKWTVSYPHLNFTPGKYLLSVGIYRDPPADETAYDYHACLYSIYVSSSDSGDEGIFHLPQDWKLEKI